MAAPEIAHWIYGRFNSAGMNVPDCFQNARRIGQQSRMMRMTEQITFSVKPAVDSASVLRRDALDDSGNRDIGDL